MSVPVGTTVVYVLVCVMPSVVYIVCDTTVVNSVVVLVAVLVVGVVVGPRTGREDVMATEDE